MHIHVIIAAGNVPATLTTERPESSYGVPVLLVEGDAYGPGDLIAVGNPAKHCPAGGLVLEAIGNASGEDVNVARRAGWRFAVLSSAN